MTRPGTGGGAGADKEARGRNARMVRTPEGSGRVPVQNIEEVRTPQEYERSGVRMLRNANAQGVRTVQGVEPLGVGNAHGARTAEACGPSEVCGQPQRGRACGAGHGFCIAGGACVFTGRGVAGFPYPERPVAERFRVAGCPGPPWPASH